MWEVNAMKLQKSSKYVTNVTIEIKCNNSVFELSNNSNETMTLKNKFASFTFCQPTENFSLYAMQLMNVLSWLVLDGSSEKS